MQTSNSAPAQAAYDTVWDTFTRGLDPQKWSSVTIGPLAINDGVVTPLSNGMHVCPPARNPSTGLPCFSLTVGQEGANGGLPGQLDHMKWLVYASHMASTGFPGFDAVKGQELSFSARITGQTFGTRLHPFGSKASDNDVRTAAFAQCTIDLESSMVFAFFFTNRRVYALYERLSNGWTETRKYAAFTYVVPVAARTQDSVHGVTIAYDRAAGIVRWILEGKEVYRVTQIGRHIDRRYMIIDSGGVEETVEMRQLNCGIGLFALLDGSDGSKPGLVRLSGRPGYYFAPSRGEPAPQLFADETSQPSSRLFGQGAELRIGAYRVSSQVVGTPAPAPGPISLPPDDSPGVEDGKPNTSPLP